MPENVIITITDYSTAFSVSIITADNSITSTVTALQDYWFKTYYLFQTREGASQ
jgi:hypothetical protein